MKNERKPMNLLFLFCDQQSREVLGCYGNPYIHSPNLDGLAARGTMFRNAYCNNPICVPSRASMHSGEYCFKNHFWNNCEPYKGTPEGWGHRLVQQGIPVTTIGKLHISSDSPETGLPDQRIPMNVVNGTGYPHLDIRDGSVTRHQFGHNLLIKSGGVGVGDSDYLHYDSHIAEFAEKFLMEEAKEKTEPWCLMVSFACPHYPWKVPKEIMDLYYQPADKLPFPKQWNEGRPMHPALEFYRNEFGFNDLGDDDVRMAKAAYYGMVTYMDMQVGRVLRALKVAGLEDNTRIIFSSDHGNLCGEHGLFYKHTMYEGSVGVPMIMAGPDIPQNKVVNEDVSLIDIFPTILEAVGAHTESGDAENKPGVSLFKIIDRNCAGTPINRPIFADYHAIGSCRSSFMLKDGNYKLIYYVDEAPQLFDLAEDPEELNDLADDPAYQDIRKALEEKLRAICDPEEVDEVCRREQNALVEANGGREKVLQDLPGLYFSVTPKGYGAN